ncbi:MAG: helicase, partial [Myxococcota bacterium]
IGELPWRVGSGMRKGAHEGHVFCATVGDRIYLRFVPFEPEGEIVGELGTCLRLLECSEDTPRSVSEVMARAAYGAWERARKSILEAWMFETDPANLQPRIRKLNRDVAAFLRANAPPDVDQERLNRALDAVESPWPRREENLLRLAWDRVYGSSAEKGRSLIDEIENIGAEPFHAPEPLPPITEEEIHLITWLALEREADAGVA